MNTKKELVKVVKEKIQYITTAAIFASAFFYSFFKATGIDDAKANSEMLIWGITIAFSILSYLLIDFVKNDVSKLFFDIINISFSTILTSIAIILIIMTVASHSPFATFWEWPFKIFLWISIGGSILTFLGIIIHLDIIVIRSTAKEIFAFIKKIVKRLTGKG